MSNGDSIDTNYNGWTGRYFDSVQAGNPLMASIQGVPWQVRGTDPASSYDTLDWFASGMQSSPAAADGSAQPQTTSTSADPGILDKIKSFFMGTVADDVHNFALAGTGVFIGLVLLVVGLFFFLKD